MLRRQCLEITVVLAPGLGLPRGGEGWRSLPSAKINEQSPPYVGTGYASTDEKSTLAHT